MSLEIGVSNQDQEWGQNFFLYDEGSRSIRPEYVPNYLIISALVLMLIYGKWKERFNDMVFVVMCCDNCRLRMLLIDTDNTWWRRDWYLIADDCRWCWLIRIILDDDADCWLQMILIHTTCRRRDWGGYVQTTRLRRIRADDEIEMDTCCRWYWYVLVALLVHSCYIASEQTAKKTQLPTIRLLLRMYLLPGNAFTEWLRSNGCLF
jgi:hypothetical protein